MGHVVYVTLNIPNVLKPPDASPDASPNLTFRGSDTNSVYKLSTCFHALESTG
jgi:hypothetical protein